jgi:hypothetical protein
MTLTALMELAGVFRPSTPRPLVAPSSRSVIPFGDVFDRALLRLACGGYSADIRSFCISPDDQRKTLAVYLGRGDARINWTSPCQAGVPLDFEYRRHDRRGAEFTIFSGDSLQDVQQFVSRLTSPCQPAEPSSESAREPRGEWDPHRMDVAEQAKFDQLMREFEQLMRESEVRSLAATFSSVPAFTPSRERRRS